MPTAASLAFSMRVLDKQSRPLRDLWTPTLSHYTGYTLSELSPVVQAVAEHVLRAAEALDGKKEQEAAAAAANTGGF